MGDARPLCERGGTTWPACIPLSCPELSCEYPKEHPAALNKYLSNVWMSKGKSGGVFWKSIPTLPADHTLVVTPR